MTYEANHPRLALGFGVEHAGASFAQALLRATCHRISGLTVSTSSCRYGEMLMRCLLALGQHVRIVVPSAAAARAAELTVSKQGLNPSP